MNHLDLFSGIGGFALATEMVWPKVEHVFCDIDPFSQAILKKHWPKAKIYDDIKKLEGGGAFTGTVDLVTGGFPCQPFSTAGKRRGTEDDRHLWPAMLRVIREAAPRWVIGENVGGLLTWDGGLVLERVLLDLEGEGYEAWPFVIPACSLNAPHRRDRVWIVAHAIGSDAGRETRTDASASASQGLRQRDAVEQSREPDTFRLSADSPSERRKRKERQTRGLSQSSLATWNNWPEAVARLCSVDDGLPRGLARPRGWRNAALKGAGNAIVPQVAAQIMLAISTVDR